MKCRICGEETPNRYQSTCDKCIKDIREQNDREGTTIEVSLSELL